MRAPPRRRARSGGQPRTSFARRILWAYATAVLIAGTSLAQQTGFEELRGRVRAAPDGARIGIRIVAIPELDSAHRRLLGDVEPDSSPRFAATTDARGAFRVRVPSGRRWILRAIAPDGRHVSEAQRFVDSSRLTALQMRPAARLALEAGVAVAWTLSAFDRDRREFFVLERGLLDASDATTPRSVANIAPGRLHLRLVAKDQSARDHRLSLAPGESRLVDPDLWKSARIRLALGAPAKRAFPAQLVTAAALAFPGTDGKLTTSRAIRFDGGRCTFDVPALGVVIPMILRREDQPDHGFSIPAEGRPGRLLELAIDPAEGRRMEFRASAVGRAVILWDRFGLGRRVLDLDAAPRIVDGIPVQEALALFLGEDAEGRTLRSATAVPAARADAREARTVAQLAADRAATLRVVVRSADGSFARQARVRAWPARLANATGLEHLFPTLESQSDRRGKAELRGLVAGDWTVRVDASPWASVEWNVRLGAGESRNETVQLDLGRAIRGRVLTPSGAAAAFVLVEAEDPLPHARVGPRYTWTDADGNFAFAGLGDGPSWIECARNLGTRRELARRRAKPGDEGIVLRLRDEDPKRR